ncbi:MAG: DUF167 family protein [Amphiplicatus sp.]
MSRCFQGSGEGALLFVRVTPNASKDEVRGLWTGPSGEERLSVRVAAPPDGARANKSVAALIAKTLGLPKSAASIRAGEKDRLKTVALAGDAKAIEARLALLIADKGSPEDA